MKKGECIHGTYAKGCAICKKKPSKPRPKVKQPACGDQRTHLPHNGMAIICPRHDVTSEGHDPCWCTDEPWCQGV